MSDSLLTKKKKKKSNLLIDDYESLKKKPKVTKPKATTPEVTKPKATKPKVTKPKATTPKVTKPKSTTPKVTKPKSTTPKVTKPKSTTPKVTKPKSTTPKVTKPKSTTPKAKNKKEVKIPKDRLTGNKASDLLGGVKNPVKGEQAKKKPTKRLSAREKMRQKNERRFGKGHVDKLRKKNEDFKKMKRGKMTKEEFIREHPKSITAQKHHGLRR